MGKTAKTILLVENEAIIAIQQAELLSNEGYNVIQALTGKKAIEIVRGNDPPVDLILMDIDLGTGMDGTEAAEEILKDRDIPIVFFSGHIEKEVVEKTEKITSYGYVVKETGITVLDASIKMAFRLHEAHKTLKMKEKALQLSEERHRNLVEAAPWAILIHIDGKAVYSNPAGIKLFGFESIEDGYGTPILDYVHPDHRKESAERLARQFAKGETPPPIEEKLMKKSGEIFYGETCSILGQHENKNAVMVFIRDITKRKLAEEALKESEIRFRSIFENSRDAIGVAKNGIHLYVNPAHARMFGYDSPDEILGKTIFDLVPADQQQDMIERYKRAAAGEMGTPDFELKGLRKDGTVFDMEARISEYEFRGDRYFIAQFRDITERKRGEAGLEKSLKGKEILFKELHHRVKNNLNVISGLLNFERDKVNDEKSKQVLLNARSRICSIAELYNNFYCTESVGNIALRQYIKDLTDSLFETYAIDKSIIKISTYLDEINIDLNRAVPLGLILNELITNILKHAYPAGTRGEIRVSLEKQGDQVIMSVADDGAGLPEGFCVDMDKNNGLKLVKMLSEQIEGDLSFSGEKGTEVSVRFML